jgi:hypothetical protein
LLRARIANIAIFDLNFLGSLSVNTGSADASQSILSGRNTVFDKAPG